MIVFRNRELSARNTSCAATTSERVPVWSNLGCQASFILGSARRRQRPAVDIGKDHVSDPSVRFVVEQQLINEFTIQAKSLGDRRRVRHAFHAQPVQDEQFGEDTPSTVGAYLLPACWLAAASIAR